MKKRLIGILSIVMVLALAGCSIKQDMKKLDSAEWAVWGEFNMEGRNSTPPRLIDTGEYSSIEMKAEYSAETPVLFLLAAYSGGNEVIPVAKVEPAATSGVAEIKLPVKKGYEIQVFTQIWMEDGSYDDNYPVDIVLSYRLTK